jgi:hypothetical protein
MAKRAKTRRNSRKGGTASRSAASRRRTAAQEGPVTLEEAKTLVAAQQPKRTLRPTVAERETLATLGEKREDVKATRQKEREQRIRDYKATMAIMKQRGVKRTAGRPGGPRRAPAAAAPSFRPLQVFAEGDSWFDYPVPFFGGSIIPRLEKLVGVPVLNLADAGDEVRFMLGVEQRKRLVEQLTNGCPAGGPWDALLFSGGGNDIVDNPLALWIRDFKAGTPPAKHINQARFDAALTLVRAGYEDLIELRDKLSPNTHIIFHGYDFAIPDGRGVCFYGPWLKPAFDMRGFPTVGDGSAVVKEMLKQFATVLATFTANPKVSFIKTQGKLAPSAGSWHNELHPEKPGFNTFAGLFHQELKTLFPSQVL